jgi:broad specificity phosphatase PhoE
MSSHTFVHLRHGERPTYSDDSSILEKWQNSSRYLENKLDEPLTKIGVIETMQTTEKLLNIIDINKYQYLYSSPLQRCIQTAICVAYIIKKQTNRDIKIRIEYGLCEQQSMWNYEYVTNNNIILSETKNTEQKSIDEKLRLDILIKKYKNYIDADYKSYISGDELYSENSKITMNNFYKTINNLIKNNKHIFVVGHGGAVFNHLYYYLTKENFNKEVMHNWYPETNCKLGLNFVAIFETKNSKYKIVLKPKRII